MASILNNFRHAFRGVRYAFQERIFKVHCVIGVFALFVAYALRCTPLELLIVIMIIGWMLTLEILNTMSEHMVDLLKPEFHAHARIIKDLASAAVLVFSFVAVIIGVVLFVPRFVDLFYRLAERLVSS